MNFRPNHWILLITLAMASGCGSDSPSTVDSAEQEGEDEVMPPTGTTARYRATFDATWSTATHPVNFPGASAHFSSLIGAVHNEQIVIWDGGQFSTPGFEEMAETGATDTLTQELDLAAVEGTIDSIITGPGIDLSPGQATVEFSVSTDYPQVTLVSMIAPSPDWFVGVHGQTLLSADGSFVDRLVIDLPAYDAGTDDGTQFASADIDANPPQSIQLVTSDPLDSDFEFGLPILGQFIFERIDP